MRVFLGNPPWRVGNRYGVRAGSRWPHLNVLPKGRKYPTYLPFPFFLAYAAAVLEREGFEVLLVDAIAEGMDDEEFIGRVVDFAPELYVTETSTPSFEYDLEYARRVRNALGENSYITLAGPHVSYLGARTLEKYGWIDAILVGEYEYSLRDLARVLKNHRDSEVITGVIRRRSDGAISHGGRRELISDLDEIPWPARHFTPMLHYNDAFCDLPTPNLQMLASRGCPFQCIFCLWPQLMYGGTRYRTRNPVNVVDEMEQVSEEYGMKSVYFDDDTFDIGKRRLLQLSAEIKKRNINLPWGVMARADTIDSETLEAMREAGLFAVKYGVESADPELLAASGKRLDLAKVEETVAVTRSLGIKFHLTFTFGLPGETWDTARRTVDYALSLEPDSVQFSIVTPFPGTRHYEWAKEHGYLLTEDWSRFNGAGQAVIRTEAMTGKELEDALRYAYETWNAHLAVRNVLDNFNKKRWYYITRATRNPRKAFRYLGTYLKQRKRRKEQSTTQ